MTDQEHTKLRQLYDFASNKGMSNGTMSLNFGWYEGDERVEKVRDDFISLVRSEMGLELAEDAATKYPVFRVDDWGPKLGIFKSIVQSLLAQHLGE